MIEFPCHCGKKFSVGQDMAGGMIQCPRCGRLNDVPLLSDLPHLAKDGTYNLELLPEKPDNALEQLTRVFAHGHVDADGVEIDLRPTMRDIERAGGEQVPLELADQVRPGVPKYDPISGELIMPVDLGAATPPAPAPPIAARPALAYATGPFCVGVTPLRILLDLFRPVNVTVMLFVLLAHALLGAILLFLAAGALLLVVVFPVLVFAIVAHYGNVVDETGPGRRDELPTPLRSLSWHDDLWGPFRDWMAAMLVCYGPAAALMIFPPPEKQIALILTLALVVAGTIAAPAALITTLTSGSILNLRPDRMLGVLVKCSVHYVALVILWMIAVGLYATGFLASIATVLWLFNARLKFWLPHPVMAVPIVVTGIYLMHYFCWYLGLAYRAHHEDFPWVYQRHPGQRRDLAKGFAVIRARRRSSRPYDSSTQAAATTSGAVQQQNRR